MNALATVALDNAAPAGTPEAVEAVANPNVLVLDLPNIEGEHSFDMSEIPGALRVEMLAGAVRSYVSNRVNATYQRYQKDPAVAAWFAYDEAIKADPLQSAVPMPTTERPAAPDLMGSFTRALDALRKGEIRRQTGDAPKKREKVDPLVKLVTGTVTTAVFEAGRAVNPKYTIIDAKKVVGADGIAYLNAQIEAKVAEGADRVALEKSRDTRFINPAKMMLGITDTKATRELPSLL